MSNSLFHKYLFLSFLCFLNSCFKRLVGAKILEKIDYVFVLLGFPWIQVYSAW